MMQSYIDINRIHRLSERDKDVPIYQKIIKLGEEAGEVSAAFLELDGAKNVSASSSAEEKVMGVLEECCDVINVSMDIINALTRDDYEMEKAVVELFQKKLDKWERKQKEYNPSGATTEIDMTHLVPEIPKPSMQEIQPVIIPREDLTLPVQGVVQSIPCTTTTEFGDFGTAKINPDAQPSISTVDERKTPQQVSIDNLHKVADEALKKQTPLTAPVKQPHPFVMPSYNFPDKLYHSSGAELVPYKGDLIYKPTYVLKPNQKAYGVQNEWNVIVTLENGKYITEHPQDHFNNQELGTEKPLV